MYYIYETKAFILKKKNQSENDLRVLVFSEEFGLIWINISGGRKEKSKLKNLVQNFNFVKLFLIKGKGGFRLTGGYFLENYFFLKTDLKNEKIKIIKNIFFLLEKIFPFEKKEIDFFIFLEKFFNSLGDINNLNQLRKKELIFISKFLYILGYFDKNEILEEGAKEIEFKKLRNKINKIFSNMDFY